MSIPRIYCPELTQGQTSVVLDGQAATHVIRVLRLKVNDLVELFNGHGFQFSAIIKQIAMQEVELTITDGKQISRESPLSITLVQSVAKGERMDWILQKSTELGVSRIIPTFTKHS